jgi:hypothetical protein
MIRTIEAVVDEQGTVRLKETVRLIAPRRAVLTIFDDDRPAKVDESALQRGRTFSRFGSSRSLPVFRSVPE